MTTFESRNRFYNGSVNSEGSSCLGSTIVTKFLSALLLSIVQASVPHWCGCLGLFGCSFFGGEGIFLIKLSAEFHVNFIFPCHLERERSQNPTTH